MPSKAWRLLLALPLTSCYNSEKITQRLGGTPNQTVLQSPCMPVPTGTDQGTATSSQGGMAGMPGMGGSTTTGSSQTGTAHTESSGGGMAGMPGMELGLDANCTPTRTGSGQPSSTAIAPLTGSALFVVNGGDPSLSVIDAASFKVKGTISLSNIAYPHHINISRDRRKLVLAVPGMDLSKGHDGAPPGMKGIIMVLDAMTGATLGSAVLDAMNHNGIFSPDQTEIWTAHMASPGAVTVLDASTMAVKTKIPVGNMPAEVTFSRDGRYGFVANGEDGTVSVIDVGSKTVVKTIQVGADPVGAWQGNDGNMYVDCEKGKTVVAINASTLALAGTYNLGFTPGMAATAPNGELWVTDGDNGKVTYYMPGSTMKMGDIPTGAGAHGITFSTDGSKAFVTNQLDNTLSVIDVAAHRPLQNLKTGSKPNGLVYRNF